MMPAPQEEAIELLTQHRRSLLVTSPGMGSRQAVAAAAARVAHRDSVPVQVVDSRAMYGQWLRDFRAVEFDLPHVVTPQWAVRHMMLPLEPIDSLTIVHLDSIGMCGTKSYVRIRDYLGDNRKRWAETPPPRMIAVIHHAELLKRLPLISHLFPVDAPVTSLGDTVYLDKLRDQYIKQSVMRPWGTMSPGRGMLARRWAESERGKAMKGGTCSDEDRGTGLHE